MTSFTRRGVLGVAGGLLAAPFISIRGWAQEWPSRPLRMLVGYPPGGLTDVLARMYAQAISEKLGQPCIVENKPGAGATIALNELAKAKPDGYTLGFCTLSPLLLNRFFQEGVEFTTEKDFRFILGLPGNSSPIIVRSDLPINNLEDFVKYAKENGGINVGSYGVGSYGDMVYAELEKEFGIKLQLIQYQGEGPMWLDIMNGALEAALGSYAAAVPLLESGKGRAIAVTRERHALIPDVQTMGEQGGKSDVYNLVTFMNCITQKEVPDEIVERLGEIVVEASSSERGRPVVETYNPVPVILGPKEADALFAKDLPVWLRMGQELKDRMNT